jgi:protein ImuB
VLGLVEPVYQARRVLEPLLARLERLELPSPAISIEMRADAVEAAALATEQLFEQGLGSRRSAAAEAELVERLRGRLGAAGVYGLELVAEHRPERVWSKLTDRLLQENARSTGVSPWARHRPLWLLSSPAPLPEGLGRLRYRGPVRVEPDPERIESGWWDGREIRRDYHMATTEQGERLWVYRDCATGEWYLHGIFG